MNLADSLNLGCACRTLRPENLRAQLETEPALLGLTDRLAQTHPNLFSQTAVYLDPHAAAQVAAAVEAIERVAALPQWVAHALERADPIARLDWGPAGAFMGYDFHLSAQGPRLIEVNTNAGGAFLNAALARAHRACCDAMPGWMDPRGELSTVDDRFVAMFHNAWRAQRCGALRTVLIVDDAPGEQYLAAEFEMARLLFERHGLRAAVADGRSFTWHDGVLRHPALPGEAVDLVYNRLTDFYLADAAHAPLRAAYEAGAVVLTPHPRAHALLADKRNLEALSGDLLLDTWGATARDRALLREVVPRTQRVTAANAESMWAARRALFFKPAAGFGSRAAYRGDKLTRRVWGEILAGDYVAQEIVAPSERLVSVDGTPTRLKLDLRAYAWQGRVLLLAARTWSGQTTNFRTAGGGFSPVIVLPATGGGA